jgi:inorganic pyrophosphatase
MNIDAIPVGSNPPEDINVIIEVPVGGEPIKYELDKASGALFVDRFLYTSMRTMVSSHIPYQMMATPLIY